MATSSLSESGPTGMPAWRPGILDHGRRHALGEHLVAFEDVGADAAIGEEAAGVVDEDRRLLDGAHVIERHRQRRGRRWPRP